MYTNPRRRRPSGSLASLKRALWAVISYNLGVIEDDEIDHELRQKGSTSLVQAALAYAKVMELHDLERDVKQLEPLSTSNGHQRP
jgi:hypothetical protein